MCYIFIKNITKGKIMKYIFIYRHVFDQTDLTMTKDEYLYKIVEESFDGYKVELIKGDYDLKFFHKERDPYLTNKNHMHIYDTEFKEHVVCAGFIYDDEEKGHEETKIMLKLNVDEAMKQYIDTMINKLTKIKNEL